MALIDELLTTSRLRIRCPSCQEDFPAKRAKLFDATGQLPEYAHAFIDDRREAIDDTRTELERRKKNARERPDIAGRTVRIGKVVEKIAATLPAFPVRAADCRSLFEPIDYVVFPGLSINREIESVHFVDVKSGHAGLTLRQKRIKGTVQSGRLSLLLTDFGTEPK